VIKIRLLSLLFLLVIFSVECFSQTSTDQNTTEASVKNQIIANQIAVNKSSQVVSPTTNLTQVFLGLIFVLGLVFALAWVLKKVGRGSFISGQHIKLLASMPLGTRERIALIEVGGKQLLLGVTSNNINTLHAFDEPVVDAVVNKELSEFGKKIKDIISSNEN
jgi:flagellar protein FliO/FliZ